MPLYKYACECGIIVEDLRSMKDRNDKTVCDCGKVMYRDFTMKKTNAPADCPRVSTALGVHPSQITSGEAERVHPGAKFNPNGDMLIKNWSEQKQRLRERNWINKDSYC